MVVGGPPARGPRVDSLELLDKLVADMAQPWETVTDSWGERVDVNLETGEVRPAKRLPMPTFETIWR